MTTGGGDGNSPPHRRTFEASGDDVKIRQDEESGIFELRMPIASTGTVRNEGDDPLTRDEVDGMARQINDGSLTVGTFVDHGQTDISGPARYSIAERVGEWTDAEVTTREDGGAELLEATARMMDPDSLPDIPVRGHLGTVKELAVRDMSVPASIGWADDENAPGGVDLMEASVVGIQADRRTHSEASAGEVVARAAVDAGADADALVREVRAALNTDARQVVTVDGEDVDLTPREAMVTAAELAREKKDELDAISDCGTGAGTESAEAIINDAITAERIDDIAAYLTSHEEDVTGINDPPSDWSQEVWEGRTMGEDDDARCGPAQYALWGGTATGTALEWAQGKANEVAQAGDEELPYPNREMTDQDTDDDREVSTVLRNMEDEMSRMREDMEENTRLCREMHQEMMPEGGDEENAGDEGMDDDEDEDEEAQSADADDDADDGATESGDDRNADELEEEIEALRKELDAVREGGLTSDDVDVPGEENAADDADGEERDSDGQAENSGEDAVKSLIK